MISLELTRAACLLHQLLVTPNASIGRTSELGHCARTTVPGTPVIVINPILPATEVRVVTLPWVSRMGVTGVAANPDPLSRSHL